MSSTADSPEIDIEPPGCDVLVVGCGNLLRGDDGVGPILVRHPWERGVPDGARLVDGGTAGMDVAFQMRGAGWVVIIDGTDDLLLVTDAGDHRVLGWTPHPTADGPADAVVGQPDLVSAEEWPYGPHSGDRFRSPYAVALLDGRLAIADTANNRILLWDEMPTGGRAADHVLGQPTFAANGENRWSGVGRDTLCWPYGIALHGDRLAVADSGNNRVMLWRRP